MSADIEGLPVEVEGTRATGWWGMVLFIGTELALFGSALIAYSYLRYSSPTWPPPGVEEPDLAWGTVATVLLVGSSLPVWLGERAMKRGRGGATKWWFGLALVMALAFLGIQAHEYASATFSWRDHAYGSAFFTVTGLHGAHVIGGILVLAFLEMQILRGAFDREHTLGISVGALYWHFVDVVWLAIFATLYLSVRF